MIPNRGKKAGTAVSANVYELAWICKEIDRDLAAEFAGAFAQKRTCDKATAYLAVLGDPAVLAKWPASGGLGAPPACRGGG
jgi:hypothetical protein